ncbi:MAG: DNA-directed RNA polymerase subunit omega [Bacteroidales bacterium]|jgi:DNA-directed RNA polymerase subunit K/omega|nr:DNA-directed RNA polymerase subunit omega [Bacteroidales bacterium]MDY0054338.1 DNA-directed RNA polymerase subunit omega [Bacteroidales bacterium]
MDYKKVKADTTTQTRNLNDFVKLTDNVYESVVVLSKRADQISLDLKHELYRKIEEFSGSNDNLEEVFENREQIEIARFYEQLPKPTLIAIHEYLNDQLVYRNEANGKGIVQEMITDVNQVIEKKD